MQTVRDATFDVLRRHDLTTVFANPGSTEVPLLAGFPGDLRFVLALHEGSVVGAATGFAIARERPALVLLHTTAGLGNAVSALATARVNRAPLVVLVGQQDRRHLALEPFLAGRLEGLAGSYPVHVDHPVRAQDVPGAVARAAYEAQLRRGPALVVVPMDDWGEPVDDGIPVAAPRELRRATLRAEPTDVAGVGGMLEQARSPALVVGAGADSAAAWAALTVLAERLGCPVWQEPFGSRAGFPQDHPLFAGHLPPVRSGQRQALAGHDVVLVVGAAALRQYQYEPGPLLPDSTHLAVVTDEPAEAHRSPADLAVLGDPARVCDALAGQVPPRERVRQDRDTTDDPEATARVPSAPWASPPVQPPERPEGGQPMRAAHVLAALADRLPRDAVLVEEAPSSRPELHALIPAREPLGFLSAAMGGLGFGLPAAAGLRMGDQRRPVVAVLGDGASLYQIQALWTAARYGCGFLAVVLANGGYAVMDQLAAAHGGGDAPWPGFPEVHVAGLARGLGAHALEVDHLDMLERVLDETLPTLGHRADPLVLEVPVQPGSPAS